MTACAPPVESESETTDHQALLLMLSYVEAECRRLGALDAARHAALAAGLLPPFVADVVQPAAASVGQKRNRSLH